MSIAAADLKFKYSTTAGAAGNTTAGTAAGSLGKYVSTTQVAAGLHNLFDIVLGTENLDEESEYRCIFLHNSHATDTLLNASIYLFAETAGGADIEVGADPTAVSAIGAAPAQAVDIVDENTPPVGVVFSAPTTAGTAVDLGDIGPGECKAIWVKRTATDSAAVSADSVTLRVRGETT